MTYMHKGIEIPAPIFRGLQNWITNGVTPGQFLCAVLRNDLKSAIQLADEDSTYALPAIVNYLYWEAPSACHGSYEKVSKWGDLHRAADMPPKSKVPGILQVQVRV